MGNGDTLEEGVGPINVSQQRKGRDVRPGGKRHSGAERDLLMIFSTVCRGGPNSLPEKKKKRPESQREVQGIMKETGGKEKKRCRRG